MGACSKFLTNSKRFNPISATEFATALLSTWKTSGCHHKPATTLGLAVSGGVDSMALVALCSAIQQIPHFALHALPLADYEDAAGTPLVRLFRDIKFQAFVVDHGVRKESDLEAKAVSEILKERKISTQLLKVDWAGHESPTDLPNFESLARKYRFQALGIACKNSGIDSLFLAHHENDQAETVLMRLITGHRMAGLSGMQISSEIPECYGLHGVHESGGTGNSVLPDWTPVANRSAPLEIESGGVKIYRPLLRFSKERLIATCQAENMEWFEDQTNKDPTITLRNAIRHMYKNHVLPAALSKPALLKLSRKAKTMKDATLEITNVWLRQCSVNLETRTGTLKVRFANLNECDSLQLEVNDKYAAALLLRRIAMLITPQEQVNLSSLMRSVEKLFPERFWTRDSSPPTATFTVAGLQFKVNDRAKTPGDLKSSEKCEWLISRQPYMSKTASPRLEFPASPDPSANSIWTAWNLYDGRFWIRVLNLSNATIVVRPFREQDLAGSRDSLSKRYQGKLPKMLSKLALGSIRWTLPAIAKRDLDGEEKVLALPTLDVGRTEIERLVKWEVRYKKVDVGVLTMAQGK